MIPFLTVLAEPDKVAAIPLAQKLFRLFGAESEREVLTAAIALFAGAALFAGVVRLLLSRSGFRYVYAVGHDMAVDVQRRILSQDYLYHVSHNTSEIVSAFEKVSVVVYGVLVQAMQAFTAAVISLFIVVVLFIINPVIAFVALLSCGAFYYVVARLTASRLSRDSNATAEAMSDRIQSVQESLGGIRDIIIDRSQQLYLREFSRIDRGLTEARASSLFIGAAPRYLIETGGMILIAALAFVMAQRPGGLVAALPTLGVLAIAAQRMLPLIQSFYSAWTSISGTHATTLDVLRLLSLPVADEWADSQPVEPLPLRDRIRVEQVSFAYPRRSVRTLDDLSFEIPKGSSVALIGRTGSGKSTLADLLMGLIEPLDGRIMIDDVPLTRETRRRWWASIAHVPQAIFLADTTIARNIAFGAPAAAVDMPRVIEAATKAQLHDFVASLPDGYDTPVGERGIRLSGGQRQRLGIARAIYKQAPVLVLDEATSALDDATEGAVMQALDALGEEGRTVIMIAHRLSTVARCDIVVRLENGRLVELGSYDDVVGSTPHSRRL